MTYPAAAPPGTVQIDPDGGCGPASANIVAIGMRGMNWLNDPIHVANLRRQWGGNMRTAPGDTSKSWDAFYAHWVKPVVHFGTPTLVVFAVLMALAVIATPLLVAADTPGVRSGSKRAGWALRDAYWLGVLCLLFSAIEATIVFPLSRNVRWARHAPWTAGVSIGLITAAVIVGFSLIVVVGKPRPENRGVLHWGIAGLCLVAAILIAGVFAEIGPSHWPSAWLSGKLAAVIYALVLAALGVGIVGRTRGIGMGLLIQGHDKTGADDAGLGAFVRARLYSLGSQQPKGILVTQQTDTSTLPSGALGLIPAGTLAKLAALFVSLFTPPTPWRVDVTEQGDGSVVVAVRRNRQVADAAVIRPSSLELPSTQANGGERGCRRGGQHPCGRRRMCSPVPRAALAGTGQRNCAPRRRPSPCSPCPSATTI